MGIEELHNRAPSSHDSLIISRHREVLPRCTWYFFFAGAQNTIERLGDKAFIFARLFLSEASFLIYPGCQSGIQHPRRIVDFRQVAVLESSFPRSLSCSKGRTTAHNRLFTIRSLTRLKPYRQDGTGYRRPSWLLVKRHRFHKNAGHP